MYKVGDKFIIEISEVLLPEYDQPTFVEDKDILYRIKGFKSLVFDKHGLNKLKSYSEKYEKVELLVAKAKGYKEGIEQGMKAFHPYDYHNGLDKAWAAVKILIDRDDRQEYNYEFAGLTAKEIVRQFPVDEVVARLKSQISATFLSVGDEVVIGGLKAIVTRIPKDDPGRFCYIDKEGKTYSNNAYAEFEKTGRNFPVADLLKQVEDDHADN